MSRRRKLKKLRRRDDRPQRQEEDREGYGLGDLVSDVTSKLGIKECGGCKRRKKKLNKIRLW